MAGSVRVAIMGLEFGAEFIPIDQAHPGAEMQAICQRTRSHLDEVGNAFGVESRYTDYAELLKDPDIGSSSTDPPISRI
jgi:predicted dehydrogenase